MEKVKFGIISTALIAWRAFIPAIQIASNAELVCVGSRDAQKCKTFATEHGIAVAHESYDAVINDPNIDAVYIPLPNSMHKEWAIKALESGKHVLCEKPLAATPAECLEMDSCAKANGKVLMEAFMYRFHPLNEFAFAQAKSGALGEIRSFEGKFTFKIRNAENIRLSADLQGGSIMDVGCYPVNASRMFLNAEPLAVSALARYNECGADTAMTIQAIFPGGKTALITCGLDANAPYGYTVIGTDGYLASDSGYKMGVDNGTLTQVIQGTQQQFQDSTNEYTRMIEHFSDTVLHGTELRYEPSEAARNMAFINAAQESAHKNGAWVNLG